MAMRHDPPGPGTKDAPAAPDAATQQGAPAAPDAATEPGTPAPGGPGQLGPSDPTAMLRSRAYLGLLVVAAILGVPISAAAWG